MERFNSINIPKVIITYLESRRLYHKGIVIYGRKLCVIYMTNVAKITEIVGSSNKSWEDAAQVALNEAKKTIRGITGMDVIEMTAKVDPSTGNITMYHTTVKIAFGVEH